ncbi:MAG: hypothetical protein JSU83_16060 [Deltaproteobacteria bacterium]|nr:MAG: hypothetical protein JSU83_16060 [Deltaproteobacteria bacterium]
MDVKDDETVLVEKGLPVIEKVEPIIYGPEVDTYHGIGKFLGKGFSIGKEM